MLSVLPLLLINVLLAVAGQLLLKKGMIVLGPIDFNLKNVFVLIGSVLKSWYIWLGVACYGFSLIFWLFVLSKAKLSMAYPFTALIYVMIIFASWLFFKEDFGAYQIIGTVVIIAGLLILFKSI